MGAATATADAPTGILSARTQGQSTSGIGGLLDADASAEIEEAVFLVPEQGSPVTPVPLGIFMDLDGSLELGGVGVPSSSRGGAAGRDEHPAPAEHDRLGRSRDLRRAPDASAMVVPNSAFTVRAVVVAESAAEAGFQSLSDMLETGRLGVVVPAGYSMVSSSGNFLTAPEPGSSIPAAVAAVGALAWARRRAASGR